MTWHPIRSAEHQRGIGEWLKHTITSTTHCKKSRTNHSFQDKIEQAQNQSGESLRFYRAQAHYQQAELGSAWLIRHPYLDLTSCHHAMHSNMWPSAPFEGHTPCFLFLENVCLTQEFSACDLFGCPKIT